MTPYQKKKHLTYFELIQVIKILSVDISKPSAYISKLSIYIFKLSVDISKPSAYISKISVDIF